jgi:hypothetical protein
MHHFASCLGLCNSSPRLRDVAVGRLRHDITEHGVLDVGLGLVMSLVLFRHDSVMSTDVVRVHVRES